MGSRPAAPRGVSATLIYLLIDSFMQLGAFAVIVMMRRQDVVGDELKDFAGLHVRHPSAFAMLLFMLSLGRDSTDSRFSWASSGYSGPAIPGGYVWLAVIGVLRRAVSLYYYIRIVVFMYVKPPKSQWAMSPPLSLALAVAETVTLVLGILYPRRCSISVHRRSGRSGVTAGLSTAIRDSARSRKSVGPAGHAPHHPIMRAGEFYLKARV